uniref:hypothetical protein n=1 Tax=Salmonella enterica TaxID=28901 RepID=UPI0032982F9F
ATQPQPTLRHTHLRSRLRKSSQAAARPRARYYGAKEIWFSAAIREGKKESLNTFELNLIELNICAVIATHI